MFTTWTVWDGLKQTKITVNLIIRIKQQLASRTGFEETLNFSLRLRHCPKLKLNVFCEVLQS